MTSTVERILRCAMACAMAACFSLPVQAQTVLTFEGLLDGESVDAFYSGGLGSLGSGPGPNAGVAMPATTVRLDSDAGGTGDFGGEPSPSAALFINRVSTINVPEGFRTGLSFFYTNPSSTTEVRLFEGPAQSGRLLSTAYFAATPVDGQGDPTGHHSPFLPAVVRFAGTARSISIMARGPGGLYLDDLTLGSDARRRAPPARYTLLDLGPITEGFRRGSGPRVNTVGQLYLQERLTGKAGQRTVFWDPTEGAVDLGTFGGTDTIATGINEAGQVVGWSSFPDAAAHAFIWRRHDGLRDLGTLGGSISKALDVNNSGQVVGWSLLGGGSTEVHAFLWSDGVLTDLNDLAITGREGWQHLERAYSLSDSGVIVGSGLLLNENRLAGHYFALMPVPN
ncbi:MAG: hypothetical protein GEU82_02900 [Luteitalea sp.]|nr:hypothetical protein [Luteitalea sp.]